MLVRAALSASLVAATALGQSFEWRRAQVDHFATCHLAFDTARNRLVALADFLHEWDGHQWVRLTAANTPSAIRDSQLAYDSLRQRLVLLQFTAGSNVIFEYDGSIWTQPPMGATTPTPRIPAAMAFDAALGMVVIFGGRPVPVLALGDTWGWNGTSWTQLATTGPTARGAAAMTFHPPTNRLVLYGGDAGSNETWTFQGLQWSQVTPATNPPAFFGHRMSTDPTTGTVWMHDGASRATWSWNGLDWTASPVLNQTARFDFGFGHDGSGPLVAGGTMQFDNAPTGDTWQLQNGTWIHHTAGGPRVTNFGLCSYDEARARVVLLDSTSTQQMRTWEWAGDHWVGPSTSQPQLVGMAMCYDLYRGRTLAFGGLASAFPLTTVASLQSWDGTSWTTINTPTAPPGRWRAAMAFDPARGEVVLHGGTSVGQSFADTWIWNGTSWRPATTTGPSTRSMHAMAYDPQSASIVMFGGVSNLVANNETWSWNGSTWSQLFPSTVPTPRFGHQILSTVTRQPTLIGGIGLVDRWQWNGGNWQPLAGDLPVSAQLQTDTVLAVIDDNGNTVFVSGDTTWLGGTSVATISSLGPGCSNGPALRPLGEPVLGNAGFAVDLRRAPVAAPYILAAGAGTATVPIGTCTVYLPAIDLAVGAISSAFGDGTVRLPVPAISSLLGVEFSLQAAALDPSSALGFALSDGLLGRIGR